MSEIHIIYNQNAEYLLADTAAPDGAFQSIGPLNRDELTEIVKAEPQDLTDQTHIDPDGNIIINMRDARGGGLLGSEHGDFDIVVPKERPLEDWRLEFWALSRAYNRLKLDRVAALFGPTFATTLERVYQETRPYHQSFGDFRVTEGARGPFTMAEVDELWERKSKVTITSPEDINHETRTARQRLLRSPARGRLAIQRTVLLRPTVIP